MDTIKKYLEEFDAIRLSNENNPDSIDYRMIERREPQYDEHDLLSKLDTNLQEQIRKLGIDRFYNHQAKAIQSLLRGEDTILETPTASGKTLSFLVPMINLLKNDPKSYALLIYPMKALSRDQRRQLRDLTQDEFNSWFYDGDTPIAHRRELRNTPPRIIFTNPEMLHMSFLGWSDQWEQLFLKNLKFIVIDEIHEYRGYFGTNVALLLRRFFHKLKSLQSKPQLFLATATCANPLEHAIRLTGRESFTLISSGENNMRPQRHFLFIKPSIPNYPFRKIFQLRIANAGLACLSQKYSALVFCPSRRFAEDVYRITLTSARKLNINKKSIAPYRSGYTAEEREYVEKGLRAGQIELVFSTNALELGIDIGKLDVIILAGFPDSVMSAWQRIGRAGRSWNRDAVIIFYALNNAVDEFYASNIDAFLDKPLDQIIIGTNNEELIERHIPYLLYESNGNLDDTDREVLGNEFYNKAIEVAKNTKPLKGMRGPNYQALNIRGGSSSIYSLIYHGDKIGTMSDIQVFREAYIGAIYKHIDRSFKVIGHGDKTVFLDNADEHLSTEPQFWTTAQEDTIFYGKRYDEAISIYYGKLTIFEIFEGYKLIDDSNGHISHQERSQEARPTKADAFWLRFEKPDIETIQGLRALEQIFRIGSLFTIPSDRFDTNTFSNVKDLTIYYYENFVGGIGLAEAAFESFGDIIKQGREIAESCRYCSNGCPRCIHPPGLKDASSINKIKGINLAKYIDWVSKTTNIEIFNPQTYRWHKKDS